MIKKSAVLAAVITTQAAASFFADMDEHFKKMEQHFNEVFTVHEQSMQAATKKSALNIASTFDADQNAVIVTIAIPHLTEKDIAFDMEDHAMVLRAKTDGYESVIALTDRSILVEQTEIEELTNKNGKQYTFVTGHNRMSQSLPKSVVLHEATAEYENGVLTLTLPSAAKKMAIPVVYKGKTEAAAPKKSKKKRESKKIIVTSTKKDIHNGVTHEETK